MKTIHKLTLLALLTSSNLLANPIDSIGLNIGTAQSNYKQTNNQGSIILGNTPNESFTSYELYTTLKPLSDICKEKNMKPYIGYTYSDNSDLKNQYLLLGLNKYYQHTVSNKELNLYAGLVVGYGELNWKYDPINSAKDKTKNASSLIGGIQLGIDYPIANNISLGVNTKYLVHNYKTNLNPSDSVSSTIEHKDTLSLSLGLSYKF